MIKKKKIGVYICHCGGNISDYVDVNAVENAVKDLPGVFLVKTTMFTCSDSSQLEMTETIKENKLDAMVVASCSPKLHLSTFRDVARRSGLNPYSYVQVNLREQCSWAHSDKTEEATEKAIKLLKAGIEKARRLDDLVPIEIEAKNSAVVIGAGISGLRTAIELADMGTPVYLIEKEHFIGGRVAQWGEVFQGDIRGNEIVERLYNEVIKRENITLFTGAVATELKGSVGSFELSIQINPRYVLKECTEQEYQELLEKCPVEIADEFNFELSNRKAIYKKDANALPDIPAIDMDACTNCGICPEVCKDKVNMDQKAETLTLKVGAILTNTGFDPYEPEIGEFGYKEIEAVVTLQQFNRLIELNPKELMHKGKQIKSVAFIYCVGSRQPDGERTYCSRYCCTAAIHAGLVLDKNFDDITSYHIHKGIRAYGKQEVLYEEASKSGNIFLQFEDGEQPVVQKINGSVNVKLNDILTEGEEIELDVDLLVLVTGITARKGQNLQEILKIPLGPDNFFNEIHPKLRPVETVMDGIFIGGTCQGPKNIAETMTSSLAATAKASKLISQGKIKLEPNLAITDKDKCVWCDKCTEICTYGAIEKVEYKGKMVAEVQATLCKGCGACMPVCPEDAIDLLGYTNNEIFAMIDAFAEDIEQKETEVKTKIEEIIEKDSTSGKRFEILPQTSKKIIISLKEKAKSIPEIASEINISTEDVTYTLMSLRKYGYIADTEEINEDEYYLYTLKN